MKSIILFCFLSLQLESFSQSICPYYNKYINLGDSNFVKGHYQDAINAYNTAMLHCPEKAQEARKKILGVFIKIDELKTNAIYAKREADKQKVNALHAQMRAEKEKITADKQTQLAIDLKESAEKENVIAETSRKKFQEAYNSLIKKIDLLPPDDSLTKQKLLAIKEEFQLAHVAIKIPGHIYSVETLEKFDSIKNVLQFIAGFNKVLDSSEINTPLRLAAFMAIISYESANFRIMVENLNYTAEGLMRVFPSKFPDMNTAKLYEKDPEKIANRVYANRLGNGDEASGDGWKYRGRGFFQTTGKANYASLSKSSGYDLIGNPEQLRTMEVAISAACLWWKERKLNSIADEGASDAMLLKLTRKVHGGLYGLEQIIKVFNKACEIFNVQRQ
jgi:Predicted chitinase